MPSLNTTTAVRRSPSSRSRRRRVDRVDERRVPPGKTRSRARLTPAKVGGQGLEELDLLVEREQGPLLAAAQAVEERPRGRPKRVELFPAHAPARVEHEHRVHWSLLLLYLLQVLDDPLVAQLEVGRGEAADRRAPARHQDLDADDADLRAEHRRRLGGGGGQQRGGEEAGHGPSGRSQTRLKAACASPGGPMGYTNQGSGGWARRRVGSRSAPTSSREAPGPDDFSSA